MMQRPANVATITRRHADVASHRVAGLLLVSLFPALFWMALAAGVGASVGHTPSASALMTFGAAVAAFLAAVGHALFSRT